MAHVVRTAGVIPAWQRQFKLFLSPPPPQPTTPHRLSFLPHHRHAHFRSRGLRLPREPDDDSDDDSDEKKKTRRNRSEMKRGARQAVRWGMDLASFSTPLIKRILKAASLEQEVFEALMLVKKLGPDVREGKRRQFNYIGKLLRDAQPELLGALIQATKEGDQSRFQAIAGSVERVDEDAEEEFHEVETEQEHEDSGDHVILASKWYDGLVNKDVQISNEVYSVDSVEFDRQELRRLVRKVHYVQDCQKGIEEDKETGAELAAAKKSLNRFLCSLAKRLSTAQNVLL